MSQETDDDLEFEVQTAAHDMDTESRLNDDNDRDARIDIDYRNEVVFERFAKDIYQSAEAGIREPLSNAITACVRAQEEYDVENPTIEITLKHSAGGQKALQLRDNGVGMSYELVEQVLSTIGNSTSRDEGNKTGKFGMGFLACYMLTGTGGSFEMHTHSREPDRDPVSGIWRPGFFEVDKDEKLVGRMGENEYGTKFIFPLDESLSVGDVRTWIRKHAKWSRVPIVYKEVQNGKVADDDEFGNRRLEDSYDDDKPVLKVENEHFKACASPDASGQVILLDSPIRGSTGRMRNLPNSWGVDVRLKNENGVVIDGPNEGLAPISERDYTARPEERQEGFVKEPEVHRNDVRLPEPTGTRDVLGNRPDFWSYLNDKLGEQYAEEMRALLDSINSVEDFLNLDTYERDMFSSDVMSTDADRIQSRCRSFDYSIDEQLAERLSALSERVEVVKHGVDVTNLRYNDTTKMAVWELLNTVGDEGDVYLAVTMNDVKAQVVWAESDDNRIVKLESASEYENYDELNWSKLKDIRSTTIDEYDVPEDVKAPFKSDSNASERSYSNPNAGRDAPDRELTVHTRSYRSTTKMTVSDIEDELVEAQEEDRPPQLDGSRATTLVLFPSGTDRKLSEHEWVCSSGVAMANSTTMVYDYLSEYDGVYHVDEFVDGIDGITLTTSAGTYTFEEIMEEGDIGIALHPMKQSSLPWFRGERDAEVENMMKRVSDTLATHDKYESFRDQFPEGTSGIVYAPARADTVDRLRPKLRETNRVIVARGSYRYRADDEAITTKKLRGRDFKLYARARLPDFEGTPEFDSLTRRATGFNERSLQLLSLFIEAHDTSDDEALSSNREDELLVGNAEVMLDTNCGELALSAALEDDREVVFHVVSPEVRSWFVDESSYMDGTAEYIIDNAEENTYRGRSTFDVDTEVSDVIYAPITPATMDTVTSYMDDTPTYVVGDERDVWSGGNQIDKDVRAFITGRFPQWDGEPCQKLVLSMSKSMTNEATLHTLQTMMDFHDNGTAPADIDI